MSTLDELHHSLSSIPMEDYPKTSRVHRLKSFDLPDCTVYIKREDELGFGISGCKIRKYLSLIPYLLSQKLNEAIVIGAAFSNHVVSITQLLIENQILPVLFLLGEPPFKVQGNFLFASLLARPENIHWFSKEKWQNLDPIANEYVQAKAKENVKVGIIPKGGSCRESIPGSLTLALDILRNEKESGIRFDHILIDSGTGMIAGSVIQAFAYLDSPAHFHVMQIAGDPEEFYLSLNTIQKEFETLLGTKAPPAKNMTLYQPKNARSFGSVNAKVLRTVKEIARSEGFFTDPVYTAKLFSEGRDLLKSGKLKGNILFIHSGGGLALSGFQEHLV